MTAEAGDNCDSKRSSIRRLEHPSSQDKQWAEVSSGTLKGCTVTRIWMRGACRSDSWNGRLSDFEGIFVFDHSFPQANCSNLGSRLTLDNCCHVEKKQEHRWMGHVMLSWKRTEYSLPMQYKYFWSELLNFTSFGLQTCLRPPLLTNALPRWINCMMTALEPAVVKKNELHVGRPLLAQYNTHSAILIRGLPVMKNCKKVSP